MFLLRYHRNSTRSRGLTRLALDGLCSFGMSDRSTTREDYAFRP